MKEYVYYVSYGSNLLEDRFLLYIVGGKNKELGIQQKGCTDHSLPLESIRYILPYPLYFAKHSTKWENKGVAFIDISKNGSSYGKGYLITKEQFLQIKQQEGIWYDKEVYLGKKNNYPLYTFTSSEKYPQTTPGRIYLDVIKQGLMDTYHEMNNDEVEEYLKRSMT